MNKRNLWPIFTCTSMRKYFFIFLMRRTRTGKQIPSFPEGSLGLEMLASNTLGDMISSTEFSVSLSVILFIDPLSFACVFQFCRGLLPVQLFKIVINCEVNLYPNISTPYYIQNFDDSMETETSKQTMNYFLNIRLFNMIYARFLEHKIYNPLVNVADMLKKLRGCGQFYLTNVKIVLV